MEHTCSLSYAAPPAAVAAMLTDPGFRERVGHAQGVVSVDVAITAGDDGETVVVLDQVQDTSHLPAVARKITGATTRAVVTERWHDPQHATLDIATPGAPTTATGTITLVADGEGTTYELALDLVVRVPLVGGRLERLMADNIDAGLTVEHAVGAAWLDGDR